MQVNLNSFRDRTSVRTLIANIVGQIGLGSGSAYLTPASPVLNTKSTATRTRIHTLTHVHIVNMVDGIGVVALTSLLRDACKQTLMQANARNRIIRRSRCITQRCNPCWRPMGIRYTSFQAFGNMALSLSSSRGITINCCTSITYYITLINPSRMYIGGVKVMLELDAFNTHFSKIGPPTHNGITVSVYWHCVRINARTSGINIKL